MEMQIYRYFKKGMDPFRNTSEMEDNEIMDFMKTHFPKHSWFHDNPKRRINSRRKIESWLHTEFIKTGGSPKTKHPCYFTLGSSSFLKNFESFEGDSCEIAFPLCEFGPKNISFTYPDSFFSYWLNQNRDHPLFDKQLNGRVLSLDELLELMSKKMIPSNQSMWTSNYEYPFYIEAQVWDYQLLKRRKHSLTNACTRAAPPLRSGAAG